MSRDFRKDFKKRMIDSGDFPVQPDKGDEPSVGQLKKVQQGRSGYLKQVKRKRVGKALQSDQGGPNVMIGTTKRKRPVPKHLRKR